MALQRDVIRVKGGPTPAGVRCIGAVRFGSMNLDASEAFYIQALGLERVFRGTGPLGKEEVIFRVPSGQVFVIEKVEKLSPRTSSNARGHHTAMHVDLQDYPAIKDRVLGHKELTASVRLGERYDVAVRSVSLRDHSDEGMQISSYDEESSALPPKAFWGPHYQDLEAH